MTEMIRDRETDCRKKVRREAQRYGARAAQHVDPYGQTPSTAADEGTYPAEGRRVEGWRGWSDSRIAAALDTSIDTVARSRQQLVEEGFESVLTRKHSPASARPRIFDGAAEAKLITLACSKPPKGRARWTLQLLEGAVVELNIVDRASDNTIGRTLKKHPQAPPAKAMGHP